MPTINVDKNRNREDFSFANINLLGKCNVDCFFCLGKDIEEELCGNNQVVEHFSGWLNFYEFLDVCRVKGVEKLYITGQNTDGLMYKYLMELVPWLHRFGFKVGIRTNGYLAMQKMDIINQCELSTGYSIHTLSPITNQMIMGRSDLPDWETIIPATQRPRISVVLNRCNKYEFFPLMRYFTKFPNIRYIQIRRVSTDTRVEELTPDMIAYEEIYTQVKDIFPMKEKIWADAEVYEIYGQDVVFWRTVKTSVNSLNYFTSGVISSEYFIVEGYLKHRRQEDGNN